LEEVPVRTCNFAAVLVATLAFAAPAAAQDTVAGAHPHRGGFALSGPPEPEEFQRITGLEEAKQEQYANLYQRYMTNTQPQRDSLKASVEKMREAFQQGDREKAREQRPAARELRSRLADQRKDFEHEVKQLLSQDQWKKYEKWRDDQRARARKQWREARGRG
jgi:Spy/CpxP family protein refolding chaperone